MPDHKRTLDSPTVNGQSVLDVGVSSATPGLVPRNPMVGVRVSSLLGAEKPQNAAICPVRDGGGVHLADDEPPKIAVCEEPRTWRTSI